MKSIVKLIGLIALVAIIGFSMAACATGNGGTTSYSLDGVWERSGGRQITVSGNTGVFSSFENNPRAIMQDAINKGYYALGGQVWRNLASTGNLTWTGLYLAVQDNDSSPNVVTGTIWFNCTFTLSANGQTLTCKDSTGTETWTRKQ